MQITKETISKPKEVLRFLALYAGKTLPSDPWTLAVISVYLKPLRNYLVLDYAGIEATFDLSKEWIAKNFEKRSWFAPAVNDKAPHEAITHFLEESLTPEHTIQTARGFQYNYTKIALDIVTTLKKVPTRADIRDAKKSRASDLALGSGSQRDQYILELFQGLDYEKQQELLVKFHEVSQAPADIPDTLE